MYFITGCEGFNQDVGHTTTRLLLTNDKIQYKYDGQFRQNVEWYLYTSSVGVYSPSELMREEDVWKTFPSDNDRLLG